MDEGGSVSVTRGRPVDMSKSGAVDLTPKSSTPPCSELPSQHSSSLPSTPYQRARKLSFDSHIRPPAKIAFDNASPRSAHSESDTTFRPPGRVPFLAGCKYETGMAQARRRIPYSVGGDKLGRVPTMPKKFLEPREEGKLSGDMRALYNRMLPSKESEQRRASFVTKLEKLLNQQWPGNDIKVHVFGSSGNMLYTSDSDVDICITTPMRALERVCLLAKALAEHGMERVVCVPNAKVPIVKIWDPQLQLACDMNVNNTLALENTRMIKTYVEIDDRVRPLAMIVKHWTKQRILNDAALGGTLSSYTWICMIINFLQTRSPPVLPSLHQRPHQCLIRQGKRSAFADDISTLRGFGNLNEETIGELLFHFFRKYAHELDYDRFVVSVREGKLISKEAKRWHLMQNNRLCVEEPFNIERNLGNTADDISFRGVHLELRRAFDMVSEIRLQECCEQFEFPAAEEKVWEKPQPQPRPVLSRSASQSGRGGKASGGTSRGGKHGNQHRNGPSNRRASSAAALSKSGSLPNGMNGGPMQDYNDDRFKSVQIHDQLYHHYQWLQAQEAQLQLILQQRAHAQLFTQATAQVQSSQYPQQASLDGLRRRGTIDPAPLSAPLRNMPGFYYHTHPSVPPAQEVGRSQHIVQTNPSSPSMMPVQMIQPPELRRSLHRSSVTPNTSAGGLRSHSQPARPSPFALNQMYQASTLGFTTAENHQQYPNHTIVPDDLYLPAVRPAGNLQHAPAIVDSPTEQSIPKEYIGYYVHDSPPPRSHIHDQIVASIPPYSALSHRMKGNSPSSSRQKQGSRSTSPTKSSTRERSHSLYSAASTPSSQVGHVSSSLTGSQRSGPIIVDGSSEASLSDYATPPEMFLNPEAMSESASLSDDQPMDTPVTASATPVQEPSDSFLLDSSIQTGVMSSYSGIPQFGEFPRNNITRSLPSSIHRVAETKAIDQQTSLRQIGHGVLSEQQSHGLGIGVDEFGLRDQSIHEEQTMTKENLNALDAQHKTNLLNEKFELRHEKPFLPIPLLSPVREVRTPSPTASRKEDGILGMHRRASHSKSSSLSGRESMASPTFILLGGKQRQVDSLVQRANGEPINGSAKTTPLPQSSGWQQTSKKSKKNKSKSTSSTASQPVPGEALLPQDVERKGG